MPSAARRERERENLIAHTDNSKELLLLGRKTMREKEKGREEGVGGKRGRYKHRIS